MTPGAAFAMRRLSHLAGLFDHARMHARGDSTVLAETLKQAAMVLDEIAPAVAACKGGPDEATVLEAACAAREHHDALVRTVGIEIDRISKELNRLSRSVKANARYGAASAAPRLRLLERSA